MPNGSRRRDRLDETVKRCPTRARRIQRVRRRRGNWVRCDERIVKIAIAIADIENWFAAVGLGPPQCRSDDLIAPLEDPDQHGVAYGVAGWAQSLDAPEAAFPATE